jgi:Glycosyl transferase family 11
MITCQLIGGLGNQLFQIATTLALAWENQDLAIFDLNGHHQLSQGNKAIHYKKTVYRNLIDRQIPPCKYIFKERGFHYQPIVYQSGMQLVGFFQSEKYFVKYRQYLLDILKPKSQIIDELKSKYEFILERPNCAMHIRRGDYVNRTQYNPICSLDYYQQATVLMPSCKRLKPLSPCQSILLLEPFSIVINPSLIANISAISIIISRLLKAFASLIFERKISKVPDL